MALELIGLYLFAYLAGAVPTPYLIAWLVKGIDLREYGSGNVGGSNVMRQLGKKWFVPLAAVEFLLKGLSPAALGYLVLGDQLSADLRSSLLFLSIPLLALVGNNWSAFLRFQGGRGLMVVCGMTLALAPLLFLTAMAVYLAGWRISGSSAIWALIAVALLPLLALTPGGIMTLDWPGVWLLASEGVVSDLGAREPFAISLFCLAILGIVMLKRLTGNSLGLPQEVAPGRVLFNRLLLDRDVKDRETWVNRVPEQPGIE